MEKGADRRTRPGARSGPGWGPGPWLVLAGMLSLSVPFLSVPARAEPPLRLVYATDITPLSFIEKDEVHGILVDVADQSFAEIGIAVEHAVYPWERAQAMVRAGEADGFITVATPERQEYTTCGQLPLLNAAVHPVVRRDNPNLGRIEAAQSLADLKPYAVVSYAGSSWARSHLMSAGFDVYLAADYESHLSGFARGRGDIVFITPTVGAYYMKKLGLEDELVMLPLVVDTFEFVLCLGKKSPYRDRLPDFEEALGRKRTSPDYAAILETYGLSPTTPY